MASRARKRKPAAGSSGGGGGGGGGGGRKSGRRESESDDDDDDDNEPEPPPMSQSQSQFPQPDEDEMDALWRKGNTFGPMDSDVAGLVEWRPTPSARPAPAAVIPTAVHEAAVKWVTKRLLATGMQRQNRKVHDLYGTTGKALKEYLFEHHGMRAKSGRKRVPVREDLDAFYLEAVRRLRAFYGFKVVLFDARAAAEKHRKTTMLGRVIVVSGLAFDPTDSVAFRRVLRRAISVVGGLTQGRLGFYACVLACVVLEKQCTEATLWGALKKQKWFTDADAKVHPQLGDLGVLLAGMQTEAFLRPTQGTDRDGNNVVWLALGQRTLVEVGLDGLVDLVEQVYLMNNNMSDKSRAMRRQQMRDNLKREYFT